MTVRIHNQQAIFDASEDYREKLESQLKQRYSRGAFIHDIQESQSGGKLIQVGLAYPQDVSDIREKDRVLKYINIGYVETLHAEPLGENQFKTEIPSRDDFRMELDKRRSEMISRLDWSTASAIYEDVYQLSPVRNQLNSIIEIVEFLKSESPIEIDRLDDIQGDANTLGYLRVLSDFGFVRLKNGEVSMGEKMETVDMRAEDVELFEKQVIGQIINDAYFALTVDLELNMLSHFPKFANSYYISAIRREDPKLTLDLHNLQKNLRREWQEDHDRLVVEKKVSQLSEAGVLHRDGDLVTGSSDIYENVADRAADLAVTG